MKVNMKLLLAQSAGIFALFALILFVPAGNWAWPAGWVFWVLFLAFYLGVGVWLYRHNPALLQERTNLGTSDHQGWDRLLFPMYSAIAVFTLGTALLLGSWYGVVLGAVVMLILARRAVLEEATLRQALPGYTDYIAQVRYRLIPRIW